MTDTNVNYIVKGDGPPVILIHGFGSSHHNWKYLLPQLASSGYRVYALDLFGHGDSCKPGDPADYSFNAAFSHLREWVQALNLSQPPVLVGHSLGGYLALNYALENPTGTPGIVLVNPFYYREQIRLPVQHLNRRPDLNARALDLAPLWLVYLLAGLRPYAQTPYLRHTRHQTALDFKRASPHILNILNTTPDISGNLSAIRNPALVVWGEKDITLRRGSFPELVHRLPNARGCLISECGHSPHMVKPELFNRVVLDFLEYTGVKSPLATGEFMR